MSVLPLSCQLSVLSLRGKSFRESHLTLGPPSMPVLQNQRLRDFSMEFPARSLGNKDLRVGYLRSNSLPRNGLPLDRRRTLSHNVKISREPSPFPRLPTGNRREQIRLIMDNLQKDAEKKTLHAALVAVPARAPVRGPSYSPLLSAFPRRQRLLELYCLPTRGDCGRETGPFLDASRGCSQGLIPHLGPRSSFII